VKKKERKKNQKNCNGTVMDPFKVSRRGMKLDEAE